MDEWIEGLREQLNEPWAPVAPWAAALPVAFLLLVVLGRTEDGWMPFLDGINLVFHEAGHPVFGILGWETLTILGGTLMQLLVPLLLGGSFWLKRQPLGVALCGQWAGQNLLNISRYMADARAQQLPLVGGGEHDWGELLFRWDLLRKDQILAGRVAALGWLLMLVGAAWLTFRAWRDRSGAGSA
ncbi:MAG TPA: hypothetical protein VJ570_01300 [Holophagaceae bacterium]|nr:hypothetical protein [Holophagaceae bacterium]